MLNYMGLIEGTFVPPTGHKLPSLFTQTRDRLQIEKSRFMNFVKYCQSHFMAFWFVKPRLQLQRSKTPKIAQEIYEAMYKALAAGDLNNDAGLEHTLAPGFAKSLQSRIHQRAHGELLEWKLHKYLERPRCVAYVFALPDVKGSNEKRTGIMQAVVRISSQQSLMRLKRMRVLDPATQQYVVADVPVDRNGQAIPEEKIQEEEMKNRKDVTEYLVLQRLLRQGEVGEWQAWGTTTETGLQEIRKQKEVKQKRLLGAA
ncbi:uncharacterized protein MYCFIDRAFT_77390 [Pseudocercospora fijiensis CIRAD86]|uniref:Uncharacterized protein n=1 Tax=Pseudocercospora fijiensis (strain CIRAD86) TaxID=383855 RepID=M3AQB7_PSEFD|nr:uncharacterized protein MYCFIDRAFT_77390 [Pseudocercospora fijiensis CIRAD86]EME86791.1 hypothetical protein MYCFIDRAFT_77390 [Pseudocercospora fijiensis CIRAD86]